MTGYKMFIRGGPRNPWNGPVYDCPADWIIRAGCILEDGCLNTNKKEECGSGVNFFRTKKAVMKWVNDELSFYTPKSSICVYKVKTLGKVIKPDGKKARTDKLLLVERIKF